MKLWDKTIGGNSFEDNVKVITTADGGYMMASWSSSDASIVKVSATGSIEWGNPLNGNNGAGVAGESPAFGVLVP